MNSSLRSAIVNDFSQPDPLDNGSNGLRLDNSDLLPVSAATSPSLAATTVTPWIAVHWDGISYGMSGGAYPPDNALAVGSGHVVTAENGAVQWSNLMGGDMTTLPLNRFFAPLHILGYELTDPRILYDAPNQRFVATVDEVSRPQGTSRTLLAISRDSNPADGWHLAAATTSFGIGQVATWGDQPLAAVDGKNVYITTNQFSASTGAYRGDVLTTVGDGLSGGLYSGGSATGSARLFGKASYAAAPTPGGGAFFISHSSKDEVSIFKSSPGPQGSNTLSKEVSFSLGNIDSGSTDSFSAAQPGTGFRLDAGDGRVSSAAYTNGYLYATFEVQPPQWSATPAVHWVQINAKDPGHPFLAAQGTLFGSGISPGAATYNSSVAIDGNGDMIINFNASGPRLAPTDYYVVHRAGTSAYTLTPPTAYHGSTGAYIEPSTHPDTVGRWGDYSTAVADPGHANGFWISSEFVNGPSSWGTAVAQVVVPPEHTAAAVVGTPTVA